MAMELSEGVWVEMGRQGSHLHGMVPVLSHRSRANGCVRAPRHKGFDMKKHILAGLSAVLEAYRVSHGFVMREHRTSMEDYVQHEIWIRRNGGGI